MKNFILNILDKDSSSSSKRFVMLVCIGLIVIGFIASTFFGFSVSEMIFKTIEYLIMAAVFGTVAEKYVGKDKQPPIE